MAREVEPFARNACDRRDASHGFNALLAEALAGEPLLYIDNSWPGARLGT